METLGLNLSIYHILRLLSESDRKGSTTPILSGIAEKGKATTECLVELLHIQIHGLIVWLFGRDATTKIKYLNLAWLYSQLIFFIVSVFLIHQ